MPTVEKFENRSFIQPFTFKRALKSVATVGTTKTISVTLTQTEGKKTHTLTLGLPMERQEVLKTLRDQETNMFNWQVKEYKCNIPALQNVLTEDLNPTDVNLAAYTLAFMEDEELDVVNDFFLKYTMREHESYPDSQRIFKLITAADVFYESDPEDQEAFTEEYIDCFLDSSFVYKAPMNLFIA